MPIPEPGPLEGTILPPVVTEILDETEPEIEPYLISFRSYNEDECEIDGGAMNDYSLDALKSIKTIGTHPASSPGSRRPVFGVPTDPVFDKNEYGRLFRKLHDAPDIIMREIKLEGKQIMFDYRRNGRPRRMDRPVNDGRIFFYSVGKIVYIVAIRATHYETTKR